MINGIYGNEADINLNSFPTQNKTAQISPTFSNTLKPNHILNQSPFKFTFSSIGKINNTLIKLTNIFRSEKKIYGNINLSEQFQTNLDITYPLMANLELNTSLKKSWGRSIPPYFESIVAFVGIKGSI